MRWFRSDGKSADGFEGCSGQAGMKSIECGVSGTGMIDEFPKEKERERERGTNVLIPVATVIVVFWPQQMS